MSLPLQFHNSFVLHDSVTPRGLLQIYINMGAHHTRKNERRTFKEAVAFVRSAIVRQAEERLRLEPDLDVPYLVVQLSDTFWQFHSLRYPQHCATLACSRRYNGQKCSTARSMSVALQFFIKHTSAATHFIGAVWLCVYGSTTMWWSEFSRSTTYDPLHTKADAPVNLVNSCYHALQRG